MEPEFIESNKVALVVIDLQQGIVNPSRKTSPYSAKEVVENSRKLIEDFKAKGVFVVLVRVSTSDGKDMVKPETDLPPSNFKFPKGFDAYVPEIADIDNTYKITKRQWGAFYGTDLDLQLRRRKISTIVLCGISTGIGVDTTAREGYSRGFNQYFVEDAMTSSIEGEHEYVCKNIFPKIGKIRTTEEIIALIN